MTYVKATSKIVFQGCSAKDPGYPFKWGLTKSYDHDMIKTLPLDHVILYDMPMI